MTDDGRWVPLPEGEMPEEGRMVRVVREGVARSESGVEFFIIGEHGVANCVFPYAEHVRSVEVWEPAEQLVPGEWYMDSSDPPKVARRTQGMSESWLDGAPGLHPDGWMRRPLSIARWEPVQ